MKIVILAGGTGSIALQRGLHEILEQNVEASEVDIKVIVNAYDNGLSTGAVRKVLGGKILGPSDVRKNQTTRLQLENPTSPFLEFMDIRFTASAKESAAENLVKTKVAELMRKSWPTADSSKVRSDVDTLLSAVTSFFALSSAGQIDYHDFSLSNIVYAGLAAQHGNSLRKAAEIMSNILGIADNVLLNDDTSLFLGAITRSNFKIADEGDIVSWNNPNDPIVDVFFLDQHGVECRPVLNAESAAAIQAADYIILSSGTQWSSLIPTYASIGFKEAIETAHGRIIMIMNRVPDKDAPNHSADDIINDLVPKYFPIDRLEVIADSTGHELMNTIKPTQLTRSIGYFDLSGDLPKHGTRHDPESLAKAVAQTIFRDFLNDEIFVFDYDDTLVGRGNSFPKSSEFCISNFLALTQKAQAVICSGNSIKAINIDQKQSINSDSDGVQFTVFADGGVNEYEYTAGQNRDEETKPYIFKGCLAPWSKFPTDGDGSAEGVMSALRLAGIPSAKIENRADVVITVKPIDPDYRVITRNLIRRVLAGSRLAVNSTGRSTIEINSPLVDKSVAVSELLKRTLRSIVYVGDEFHDGNDAPVAALNNARVKCLAVSNPVDTAFFFIALAAKSDLANISLLAPTYIVEK